MHKTIWSIAEDLRGSIDGWDFKSYVLGFLFYRFISERFVDFINQNGKKANPNFDYRNLSDEVVSQYQEDYERIVRAIWFFIKPSNLFSNIFNESKKDKSNLNILLKKAFKEIEDSSNWIHDENDFKGLFSDIDFDSNKLWSTVAEKNKKIYKVMNAINELDLSHNWNTIDVFGDAYEFLMTMYAANAGKSGGDFFTPQEVSELLAKIVIWDRKEVDRVYDPTCGSGSLLLKFAKVLGDKNIKTWFYGQELNLTTYNLCRINMILHGVPYNKFDIRYGDTLIHPSKQHNKEWLFDAIVSNPPYSTKWEWDKNSLILEDERFKKVGALAPASKADLAFTMHMLHLLSNNGTAAIVEFPGVLYRNWSEQRIREYLLKNNFIDTVIQLPSDLFFWTSIATCILVLKKNKKDNNVLFIDASKEYKRVWNKNKLLLNNQNHILSIIKNREEEQYFSKLVDKWFFS